MPTTTAKSAKLTIVIADADFPLSSIPERGPSGSATLKVALTINVPQSGSYKAVLSGKNLTRQREVRDAQPAGHWVLTGRPRAEVSVSRLASGSECRRRPPRAVGGEDAQQLRDRHADPVLRHQTRGP